MIDLPVWNARPDVINMDFGMGRVVVTARFENLRDALNAHLGLIPATEVKTVDVTNALVDTGCTHVGLPKSMIEALELVAVHKRPVRSAIGAGLTTIYSAVRLTIQGRDCVSDVMEIPDDIPVLIGQIPLESMDFVIDMGTHTLIGNPEHGGEHIMEMY